MNKLDSDLLALLVRDARLSFAELARALDISRAHARNRVQALVDAGVIEQFAAVVNPDKLGKVVSSFIDLKVRPAELQAVAEELADCPEVVSLYIMNDLQSLHIHTLTDSAETFEAFVRRRIFGRPEVISVDCKTLLARVKNRRGGMRV
jgi:DNA-binding Lrp family transcriptional regulator